MSGLSINPRARPLRYSGEGPGVLLLHGLTGSPYTFGPLARALSEQGYDVSAPLLPGHGTTPNHLRYTGWNDWLVAARRSFDELSARHEKVFIIGFSMGALLSTVIAQERGQRVGGLVAMAVPLELDLKSQTVLSLARKIPIAAVYPFVKKANGPDVSDPAIAASMPSYDRTPISAAASMLDGQGLAADRVQRLSVPVLVLHGRSDHVAPVRNARVFYDLLETPNRRLIIYPKSWHILPLDVEHEQVEADILDFLRAPERLGLID
ncbi:MAG: hypothetical protein CMH52_03775 [Myxococcales bacterium]|nr:hypothetical protein [Myxococcales bacterium]